jgi:hypothetical protein
MLFVVEVVPSTSVADVHGVAEAVRASDGTFSRLKSIAHYFEMAIAASTPRRLSKAHASINKQIVRTLGRWPTSKMSTSKMPTVKMLTSKMPTSKMPTVKMSTSKMPTVKMSTW